VRTRVSWRSARFAVVDIEATGLDLESDEIVSFGAVPVQGGMIQAGAAVYGLVRPAQVVTAPVVEIHGIRPQDLESALEPPAALEPLAEAMRGRFPVAHAAWIERGFLGPALRPHRMRLPRRWIDTTLLWRVLCIERTGEDPGFTPLGVIASELGLPVHHPHHALGDALTTAQVFLALATHLEKHHRGSVHGLQRADRRLMQHEHMRRYVRSFG